MSEAIKAAVEAPPEEVTAAPNAAPALPLSEELNAFLDQVLQECQVLVDSKDPKQIAEVALAVRSLGSTFSSCALALGAPAHAQFYANVPLLLATGNLLPDTEGLVKRLRDSNPGVEDEKLFCDIVCQSYDKVGTPEAAVDYYHLLAQNAKVRAEARERAIAEAQQKDAE